MTETKTESLFQLQEWGEGKEDVPYPYMVSKNDGGHGKWRPIAAGTEEQMLAYWKLIDPVSWAKELEGRTGKKGNKC